MRSYLDKYVISIKSKKVIAYVINSMRYGHYHTIVDQTIDIELITNLLIKNDIFKSQLNCDIKNPKFINLFYIEYTKIILDRLINTYLQSVHSNWNAMVAPDFNL